MNDNPHIFTPQGRIDASNAATAEREVLAQLEISGFKLVIDLSAVEYLSSAGLRVLLVAAKTAKQKGGQTVLAAARPAVAEVFKMSGFDKIMKMTASTEEGLTHIASS